MFSRHGAKPSDEKWYLMTSTFRIHAEIPYFYPAGDRIQATKSSHKSGRTPGSDPTVLSEDGMLADIEVQPLVAVVESKTAPTADIKKFSGGPTMIKRNRGPELKLHRKCITCG
jgi:hypothetical protein